MANVEPGLPYGEKKRREELMIQGPKPRGSIAEPDQVRRPITEGMAIGPGGGPEMLPNIQQMVNNVPAEDFTQLVNHVAALEFVIDGAQGKVDPRMLMLVRQLRAKIPAQITAGLEE